jgi:hypothetical protein
MTNSTLLARLRRIRRDREKPLRVLVLHDGIKARKRVERLLLRIRGQLGADLRMACAYQQIDELGHWAGRTDASLAELIFLAASCCAALPMETIAQVASLLPALKTNHGALAFLSGTGVPRLLDVVLAEQFLRRCAQRAGVAFFSGCMPGLGCTGCGTPKCETAGKSGAKRRCVLHAPGMMGASIHRRFYRAAKLTKIAARSAPPGKAKSRGRMVARRPL